MLDVLARNEYGFSINFKNNSKFDIVDITGLNPVNATINSYSIPNYSGSIFNSSYVGNRNIVLSIICHSYDDKARKELNNVFIPSKQIRLELENYYIDGYVESTEYNPFNNKIIIQTSILCLYPYFSSKNENTIRISNITNLLEFPASFPAYGIPFGETSEDLMANIVYNGEIGTGCIIKAFFTSETYGFKVNNVTHNQVINTFYTFDVGDELTIDTRFAKKSIVVKNSEDYTTNLIPYLSDFLETKWIELESGENQLIFTNTSNENLNDIDIYLTYNEKIGGM